MNHILDRFQRSFQDGGPVFWMAVALFLTALWIVIDAGGV